MYRFDISAITYCEAAIFLFTEFDAVKNHIKTIEQQQ